jgi:hypothetical protein
VRLSKSGCSKSRSSDPNEPLFPLFAAVVNDGNVSQHFCARKDDLIKKREEQGRQEGLGSSEGMWLFFFPNASFSACKYRPLA